MSIKNLFAKSIKSYESSSADVESTKFADSVAKERQTFLPPIDFSSASNFVKYGSAELYYTKAIERIYEDYPYDGSEREKTNFHLSSSYLERWMFENKYPKTAGHIILGLSSTPGAKSPRGYGRSYASQEFIDINGGIHTASAFKTSDSLSKAFEINAKYSIADSREHTFKLNFDEGITVEFYLQKTAFHSNSDKEVILDLWNGNVSSSSRYGRLTLELDDNGGSDSDLILTVQSGTTGFFQTTIATGLSLSSFNHYAVSLANATSDVTGRFYTNGSLTTTTNLGSSTIQEIRGLVNGRIGALLTTPSSSLGTGIEVAGDGKLSGSLDELRFWKTRRTSRQIDLNYKRSVGGGTNTDDFNTGKLGLYFKFNEGITGNPSIDSTVLDYSGRLANGRWTGYASGARNTGSAFISTEILDPIIYETHPQVTALVTEFTTSGSNYDRSYGGSIYNSMPQWMRDEDVNQNLKYINQIISSYFDTLHAQITALPNLRDKGYVGQGQTTNERALPFIRKVLEDKGFITRDIFINSEVFETLTSYDSNGVKYAKNIDEVKNLIYTNIYNNLENIYKSKGTEKSIRNLIRCFGVDDEIVKLNVYTDQGTHFFTDKSKGTSVKKKYISFNSTDSFSATMFQTSSADYEPSFITGSRGLIEIDSAFTFETDVIIPRKLKQSDPGYFSTPFLSSSIFGFHEVPIGFHDYSWHPTVTDDKANLQVFLVKDKESSKDAKFVLKNRDGTINLESDFIKDIYDDKHFNIALRVKPDSYPYKGNVTELVPVTYTLEMYAVCHNFDEVQHEITLTKALTNQSGSFLIVNPKRLFFGAHRENFSGSVQQQSDVLIGGCRAYLDYLEDPEIKAHNKDATNFGLNRSFAGSNIFAVANKHVPKHELLFLNWDFDTVTTSNASGQFVIDDLTSGSISSDTRYGPIDSIIRREHRGLAFGFSNSSTNMIDNQFVYAQKKELPEISFTNDNIFIKGDREINFITDDDVSDNFFMLEKSMNAIVSEEMLKMFSTVQEFSNIFARPVDRYRDNYKRLDKVRQLFFETVTEDIDFETFMNYFKWIDASISQMISQLFPASTRFAESVADVVESHMLERNKVKSRIGLLDRYDSTEGSIRGTNELRYNWQFGHAPNYKTYDYQNNKSLRMAQDANDVAVANLGVGANKFCLAFWTKADVGSSTTGQITLRKAANEVFRIDYRNSGNAYRIRLKATGSAATPPGQNLVTFTGTTIADDTWAHVVLKVEDSFSNIIHTASSADASSNLKVFINGVEAVTSDPASDNTNTAAFLIEGAVDRIELNSNSSYDTHFDEISFITGSLTNSQISELYNNGKFLNPTSDQFSRNNAVVAHWRMGDTSGDTAALIQDTVGDSDFVITGDNVSIINDVFDQGEFVKNIDNVNCLWAKSREERDDIADRETIRQILVNQTNQTSSNLAQPDKTIYQGSTFARRNLSRPYKISAGMANSIHGGTNYSPQKDRNFVRTVVSPHGGLFGSGAPKNVFGIGLGGGQGIIAKQECDDVLDPNNVYKFNAECVVGRSADELGTAPLSPIEDVEFRLKTEHSWPFNIISGSVLTGYNARVDSLFKTNSIFTNVHSDTIDITNEIPMQGPFTNEHVGGNQHRHVKLNKHDTTLITEGGDSTINNLDDQYTRPEAWRLLLGEHVSNDIVDGAAGFVGPDYGGPYPNVTRKWAIYFRDERAKRPVNLKNIQTTTASAVAGNYYKSYEFLSSFSNQNYLFRRASGSQFLPPYLMSLPETTNALSLVGVQAWVSGSGNIFGPGRFGQSSNRLPDGELLIPEVVAVAATGRFHVTGAINAAQAPSNGSFRVSSSTVSVDGDFLRITTGGGQVDNYEVEKGGGVTGGYHSIDATAGNTVFWDDLKNTIASDLSSYTVAYSPNYDTHSIAVSASATGNNKLESTAITGDVAGGGFGIGFYLFHEDFVDDRQKTIYMGRDATNQRTHHVFITSGSLFADFTFEDTTGTTFTDSYKVNNFTGSYQRQRVHVAISHNGTFHVSNATTVYVNGSSVTVAGSAAVGSPSGDKTVAATTKITLFNSDVGTTPLFPAGASGPIYLDEVTFYPTSIGSITVNSLYNNGIVPATLPGSPFAHYNFQTLTAGAAITNSQIIAEASAGATINDVTASIAVAGSLVPTTGSGDFKIGIAPSLTAIQTPGYAQFTISNAPVGSNANLTITNGSNDLSFGNFVDAVGGVNAGVRGVQPDDRILFTDTAKVFKISDDPSQNDGTPTGNFYIQHTGSSTEIWTMLKFKIGANTDNNVTFIDLGNGSALFNLTASSTGAGGNDTLSEVGTSFTNLDGIDGGVTGQPALFEVDVVNEVPRTDLTSSNSFITTKFSAPGGPEVNTRGYLDYATGEKSVYNSLNYRNLSVRTSGSGEFGTIRIESNRDQREGLQTLLSRHAGKFGLDSTHGSERIEDTDFNNQYAAFHKQHRNSLIRIRPIDPLNNDWNYAAIFDVEEINTNNNALVSSPIPTSDFQYSWINNSVSGSHGWRLEQKVFGHAPRSGILSSSVGFTEAIVFPSASLLFGED